MAKEPVLAISAGWRTGDLLLQLLASDSGLDDTIQVPFNVFLLLDGEKTSPFPCSQLAWMDCELCAGLLCFTAQQSRGYFCFGF